MLSIEGRKSYKLLFTLIAYITHLVLHYKINLEDNMSIAKKLIYLAQNSL